MHMIRMEKTTQKCNEVVQEIKVATQKDLYNDQKEEISTQKIERTTTHKGGSASQSTQKKIIQELMNNPKLGRKQLAQLIPGITEDGIKYHLSKLQKKGIIRRVGPDKGGHWEILN